LANTSKPLPSIGHGCFANHLREDRIAHVPVNFMKKCSKHDTLLVARRMTWTDRYKRVRSMTVYVCPAPGCGKMRPDKTGKGNR
jgi:hypothetical protein